MIDNGSYKISLIFAISFHVVLILFLLVKFTTSKSVVAFSATNNFINATAINERDFDDQMNKKMVNQKTAPKQEEKALPETVKQEEKVPSEIAKTQQIPEKVITIKKPVIKKEQLQSILQKNLLMEQAKEIAELKKERQKYKKNINKQRQQEIQKNLRDQILAEQKQLAREQSQAKARAQAQAQAQAQEQAHGHRLQGEVDKYKALILQAISSQWIIPEGVDSKSVCRLLINVAPGGVVLNVQLVSSSGNLALDRSAQAAVLKASPLPVPEDVSLFDRVRTINLTVRPEGMVGN